MSTEDRRIASATLTVALAGLALIIAVIWAVNALTPTEIDSTRDRHSHSDTR